MKSTEKQNSVSVRFLSLTLLAAGFLVGQRAFADSVSFNPASGIGGSPITVTVEGFIGTNGPAPVSVGGAGISGGCSITRPCSFQAAMPRFPGIHWVEAQGLVDGVGSIVSNSFTVLQPTAMLGSSCGTNGQQVIVSGHHFARNDSIAVSIDGFPASATTQADTNGMFSVPFNVNVADGLHDIIVYGSGAVVSNSFVVANLDCGADAGVVRELQGSPTITRPGGQPQPLQLNDRVRIGDVIQAGAGGRVGVDFLDNTTWALSANSKLEIDNYVYDPNNSQGDSAQYSFLDGAFGYVSGLISKNPDPDVHIITAFGNIGIRGTEFISRRDPCSTTQEVYLIHGQLAIKPTYASVTNIVDAPATILFDATNVWTSGLTQAAYDALVNQVNQTNPVTFASWQVEHFGCTNNNPSAAAAADPDGDGQNNYAEFLTRTDPITNASVFRLISGVREGDGVRLVWKTHGGITNAVQAAASLDGSFTNISSDIIIPGDDDVTTNYLDAGVITNAPARFYRVRLVQ